MKTETRPAGGGRKKLQPGVKQRGREKVRHNPVSVIASDRLPRKPDWIRVRVAASPAVERIKGLLRQHQLHTVCEEASCPNLGECFGGGTATFMIMGDICTRRCPFCDVAHGRPNPLNPREPAELAKAIQDLGLRYVVITSVDRDDLRDGGAEHFAQCITEIRTRCKTTEIEILVPDFRGRMERAIGSLISAPPDIFNHNIETIPRLYRKVRPGADYEWSLKLLQCYGQAMPGVPTKSGLMLGLGETRAEVEAVLADLRAHGVQMVTLGQYLQPSRDHLPVEQYVPPEVFDELGAVARDMGFSRVASGPLVRSSYHADLQAHGKTVC